MTLDQERDGVLALGGMPPGARALIPGGWQVPAEVRLDDAAGLLCWTGELRPARPETTLLGRFLKIRKADNHAILRFAQQWGPLWLCDRHGLPIMDRWVPSHELARVLAAGGTVADCGVRRLDDGWFGEPLDAWHRLATEAFYILVAQSLAPRGELRFEEHDHLLANLLGLPKNTLPQELRAAFLARLLETERRWASLGWIRDAFELGIPGFEGIISAETMVGPVRDRRSTKEQFARTLQHPDAIAQRVNEWIEEGGGFRQSAVYEDGQPVWREDVPSLYAAVGVGLWSVIGDMAPGRRCAYCGQAFTPTKSSQKYCQECGRQPRNTINQRRSREKKKGQAGHP